MRHLVIPYVGLLCAMFSTAILSTLRAEELADTTPTASYESEEIARQLFALSDAVLTRHVDPPTRQEMYLAAAKGLLLAAKLPADAELSRRLSSISTEDQFRELADEIWTKATESSEVSHDELSAAMQKGLLDSLTGGARLISANDLRIQSQLQGNRYVGIGISLSYDKDLGYSQIIESFVKGPGHRAGIRSGDLIVRIDDADVQGTPLQEVVTRLRGEEGTAVKVGVRQPDSDDVRSYDITRGVVPRETVLGFKRKSDDEWSFRPVADLPVGYVRIREITSSTLHELRQVERQMIAGDNRAVVLDIRSNPGGRMHDHVSVANALLDGGTIARTRVGQRVEEYEADPDCLFRDWPIVLLTDRRVAGGVEALAAALQDQERVVVVGEPTAGLGFIRSAMPLPNGEGSLILPVGVLERADGTALVSPQAARPNVARQRPVRTSQDAGESVRWRVEPDHRVAIANGELAQFPGAPVPKDRENHAAPDDTQLAKAIELLKSELGRSSAS